ncbi:MAG: protease complex subunit PrcB family protein [Clostridiales bacterium]|nr:protease complex subunit PrcB family protein [Clostridiales bacterium]
MPDEIRKWAEQHKVVAGVYETVYQGKRVYLLAAGEYPTGGYGIKVTELRGRSGVLAYQVVGPGRDDFVIQIITYPYELVFSEDELRFVYLEMKK